MDTKKDIGDRSIDLKAVKKMEFEKIPSKQGSFDVTPNYRPKYQSRRKLLPLMNREPNSVLGIWLIGMVVSALLFFIVPIFAVITGVVFWIAILIRIDKNGKLLRKQITYLRSTIQKQLI